MGSGTQTMTTTGHDETQQAVGIAGPAPSPPSVLERLAALNNGTEIWWDSSPLVFESWRARMLAAAPEERRAQLAEQLLRLWDPAHPEATLFRGVTTNPPLSLAAIRDDPARWLAWIRSYRATHPAATVEGTYWSLYKEIVRLGAEALLPLHEATGYRFGYLSGQVDPRSAFDSDAMLRQASELAALAPNVMVKVPGTSEGLPVLRELTRRGISTNCTLAYTLPQFVAVAEEVQAGLIEARRAGADLTRWRSVVTDMSTRWENAAEFAAQAAKEAVELSAEDRRWAGIAIFKRAQRLFRYRAYPSKMLICSVRMGPGPDTTDRCWHLEYTAGADAVFTLPPAFLADFILRSKRLRLASRIWEDIPTDVMTRLRRVCYFSQAYEPDGIPVDAFDRIPALQNTTREFSKATNDMVDFVRREFQPATPNGLQQGLPGGSTI